MYVRRFVWCVVIFGVIIRIAQRLYTLETELQWKWDSFDKLRVFYNILDSEAMEY